MSTDPSSQALSAAVRERPLPPWQAYILAFTASACSLIIELVAGRIMAPIIGVSLYTWTSIIGVVLAGISLGNFLGGKLADRFGSRRTLFVLLILSGLAALSVLYTAPAFGGLRAPLSLPLLARIVVVTAAIFFLPSCVLGTISPLLVKLTLRDLSRSGDVVGKISAISTAGSILGTFATGFYLISLFGTRAIMLGVGLICFALAILFGDWSWIYRRKTAVGIAVFLLAASPTPIRRQAYFDASEVSPRPDIAQHLWEGAQLEKFLADGRAVILSDEYAPVDNLLAPVLEERGY